MDEPLRELEEIKDKSSNLRSSASPWLPLAYSTLQDLDTKKLYSLYSSFPFHHFPRPFMPSNIKTENEYEKIMQNREPIKNLFFDKDNKKLTNKEQNLNTTTANYQEKFNFGNDIRNNFKAPAINKPPSLAAYRLHPLFHYIKNKNIILQDKIIRLRQVPDVNKGEIVTLILKPRATSVAGVEGKAVSNPLSQAILRKGTNVDILFEPAAVAIAGPGGIAHAQSDLEISYELRKRDTTKISLLPFYGGGKGQSLQITETADGQVLTTIIIKTPESFPPPSEQTEVEVDLSELENPALPSKYDTEQIEAYEEYIKNIQYKAAEIVKLQDIAQKNGKLTEEEEKIYHASMLSINESAKKLAEVQESSSLVFENREGLSHWFDRKRDGIKNKKKDKDTQKKDSEANKKEEEKKKTEKQENKKEEEQEEEGDKEKEEEEGNDGVAISLPPDDASVAEAKPVGLAVAGEGGVAASKPIATAVVGPGGLAIARPVATAIAGVSPDQALIPIYAEGSPSSSNKKNSKNKTDPMSEFLNKIISKYHHT